MELSINSSAAVKNEMGRAVKQAEDTLQVRENMHLSCIHLHLPSPSGLAQPKLTAHNVLEISKQQENAMKTENRYKAKLEETQRRLSKATKQLDAVKNKNAVMSDTLRRTQAELRSTTGKNA